MFGSVLALVAAIVLQGVTGKDLRVRAYFDANNVKVGDPLVLTFDFVGQAEFSDIHPPQLSRVVGKKDWKIDDASAKTDTSKKRVRSGWFESHEVAVARTLTYRVRPMREGVLWFPSLEFEYEDVRGGKRSVRSNEIPVHAKPGAQVVVAEMDEVASNEMPKPPELVGEISSMTADDDLLFAWRRTMSRPSADGFAAFGFPEAKMNEATCAIREGNWARALEIYQKLEWRIGQTAEIEKGIVAALALKYDNNAVELPVWRQVLRPVLRYGWQGRVGLVVGGFAALVLLFWLLGRGIRAVACVGLVLFLVWPASAKRVETVVTNADGSVVRQVVETLGNGTRTFTVTTGGAAGQAMPQMRSMFGGNPFGGGLMDMMDDMNPFGGRRRAARRPPVAIGVRLEADKPSVSVGEDFNLTLSLEVPRYVSLSEGVQLAIDEQDKLQSTARGQSFETVASRNPTNVIQRIVFPMRALAPIDGPLHFEVSGSYAFSRMEAFFDQTHPFKSGKKRTSAFAVRPFPAEGRPDDFGGIVSRNVRVYEYCDLLRLETNDVVTITYKLYPNGYVPSGYMPREMAFGGDPVRDEKGVFIPYRRYFVADGVPTTPVLKVPYFDPQTKTYKTAKAGGTPLKYVIIR